MRAVIKPSVAVFGASGSIGQAICSHFVAEGWKVLALSRKEQPLSETVLGAHWLAWDREPALATREVLSASPIQAVVWAQGRNCTDSIHSFDEDVHVQMYEANVLFVLRTLDMLLRLQALARPARLCVVSSIWQDIARPNKLSYCVSKAALRGLVQSVALDLGGEGHLINAVLPGALDTPMTHANLTETQLRQLADMTPLKRLATLRDVCAAVLCLCSPNNTSVTGQFIAVDGGFSHAKML